MTETPSIQVALARVKAAVGAVKKAERNSQQGFNFRGIDAVVNAAAPALNEHGIVTVPHALDYSYETVEIGKNRTAMGHVLIKVAYRFYGPAGDFIESVVVSESMDSGDKAMAKAMSVAYRIALLQTLNLPTDEPDPDSESFERSTHSAPPRQARTPAKTGKTGGKTLTQMVELADSAKTVEELREVWKVAGQEGHLPAEMLNRDSGEKVTYQNYLYQRHDELTTETAKNNLEKAGLV